MEQPALPENRPKTLFRFFLFMGILIVISIVFIILTVFAYQATTASVSTLSTPQAIHLDDITGNWIVNAYLPSELDGSNVRDYTMHISKLDPSNLQMQLKFNVSEDKIKFTNNEDSSRTLQLSLQIDKNQYKKDKISPARFSIPLLKTKHVHIFDHSEDLMVLVTSNKKKVWILSKEKQLPNDIMINLLTRLKKHQINTNMIKVVFNQ